MPNFAANLTMLFNEVPVEERFQAAAEAGFEAVEILFPDALPPEEFARQLQDNGLKLALFNVARGDWDAGERGISALPGREDDFQNALDQALSYARATRPKNVHVMAGIVEGGLSDTAAVETFCANLHAAAEAFAEEGVGVVIEPLNTRAAPGYLMSKQGEAREIIERVGHANIGLQFDIFHAQIMEGDVAMRLREFMPIIGHIQIAGVPERHEPDTGELNYPYLFDLLDELGYTGWVGCEYQPRTTTLDGLGWFKRGASK